MREIIAETSRHMVGLDPGAGGSTVRVVWDDGAPVAQCGIVRWDSSAPDRAFDLARLTAADRMSSERAGLTEGDGRVRLVAATVSGGEPMLAIAPTGVCAFFEAPPQGRELDVVLQRGHSLRCRVVTSDGDPVPNIRVWVTVNQHRPGDVDAPFPPGADIVAYRTGRRHGALSDAEGRVILQGLPRGHYTLNAVVPAETVIVNAGDLTAVAIPGDDATCIVADVMAAAVAFRGDQVLASSVRARFAFPSTPTNSVAIAKVEARLRARFPEAIVACGMFAPVKLGTAVKTDTGDRRRASESVCRVWLRSHGVREVPLRFMPARNLDAPEVHDVEGGRAALSAHLTVHLVGPSDEAVDPSACEVLGRWGAGSTRLSATLRLGSETEVPSGPVVLEVHRAVALGQHVPAVALELSPGERRAVSLRSRVRFQKCRVIAYLPSGGRVERGSVDFSSKRSGNGITMFAPGGDGDLVVWVMQDDTVRCRVGVQGCERFEFFIPFDPTIPLGASTLKTIHLSSSR